MTLEATFRPVRPARTLRINVPALLTFGALAALVFSPALKTLGALAFLLFAAALLASNLARGIGALMRWWYLLLLPAYCLASALWSDYPDWTLRYAIQLSVTLALSVLIASRIGTGTLLRTLFFAYGLGTLGSLLLERGGGGAWRGMFGSKNAFGAHVAFFMLMALGLVLERSAPRALRLTALAALAGSAPLLLFAQSAGVLLTVIPCAAAMVLVMAGARLSGKQKLFALCLAGLVIGAGGLFLLVSYDQVLGGILEATGKDDTLTGRTDLWALGLKLIAEHPLLGVGYRGFWVPGNGAAEQVWAAFHLASGAGFNFHNTYISNAVELGLVGLSLQLCVIYGGLGMLVWLAVVRPSGVVAFLLGAQLMLVLRSFIEVEVFFEFSVRSMLTICAFIYAARGIRTWRAERQVRALHPRTVQAIPAREVAAQTPKPAEASP